MATSATAVDLSIGDQLAYFLAEHREKIMERWVTYVHQDEELGAVKNLDHEQLKDHLPAILDSLSDTLREAFSQGIKEEGLWKAAKHGHIRWKQDCNISELIREFALLRTVLIQHLVEFQESHQQFGGVGWLFGMTVVHGYLDDAIRASAEEYVRVCGKSKP